MTRQKDSQPCIHYAPQAAHSLRSSDCSPTAHPLRLLLLPHLLQRLGAHLLLRRLEEPCCWLPLERHLRVVVDGALALALRAHGPATAVRASGLAYTSGEQNNVTSVQPSRGSAHVRALDASRAKGSPTMDIQTHCQGWSWDMHRHVSKHCTTGCMQRIRKATARALNAHACAHEP